MVVTKVLIGLRTVKGKVMSSQVGEDPIVMERRTALLGCASGSGCIQFTPEDCGRVNLKMRD